MKNKYRILEHEEDNKFYYTVQERKLWGLYWGVPEHHTLGKAVSTPAGLAYRYIEFANVKAASQAILAVVNHKDPTVRIINIIT